MRPSWVPPSLEAGDRDRAFARPASVRAWGRVLAAAALLGWSASFVVGFRPALAALVMIGFGAAVVGLLRPDVGVLGIGFLCTLDAPARHFLLTGGIWRWNTFNYWLLVVLIVLLPVVLRWSDWHTRTLRLLVFALAAGLLISPDPLSGVQHILSVLAAFGLMAYMYRGRSNPPALYWMGVVCGLLAAIGSLAFFLHKNVLPEVNANAMAFLPLTGLFAVCLGFPYAAAESRGRLKLLLLAGANLAAVFLTGSRGGMLVGAVCALFLIFALRGFTNRIAGTIAAGVVGIGLSMQFTDLQSTAVHRLDKLLDPSYSVTARTSGRSDLALGALYIFRDHPLGIGTGGFAVAWSQLGDREGLSRFGRWEERQAHSGWAKTLAENGIPGIALLLAYVCSFAVVGWRRRCRHERLLGSLVTVVLALSFASTEFQSKGLWLLAAGVATLLHYRAHQEPVDRQASRIGGPLLKIDAFPTQPT